MPDIIRLEGMSFFGRHGVHPEEKALGQHFVVDVTLEANLEKARQSDALKDTLNYAAVHATVREVIEGPSRNLLERLADETARRVMERFQPVAVTVRVTKPRLPMDATLKGASVEVRLERQGA